MSYESPQNKYTTLKKAEQSVVWTLLGGLAAGLIGIIGYPCALAKDGVELGFVALLIALASFATGLFTGILFGVPKRNADNDSNYTLNNSLVEISDWLTKIIVGLGLVNLRKLPAYLDHLGSFISNNINIKNAAVNVFAISVIIYFGILGLYIGYNYMRLVLSQKYKSADDNLFAKIIEQNEALKNAVKVSDIKMEHAEKKNSELTEALRNKDTQTETLLHIANEPAASHALTQNTLVQAPPYVAEMIRKAKEKFALGKAQHPTDPQKGQWGRKNVANDRELSAEYREISQGVYHLTFLIKSTNDARPLNDGDFVLFALHDSYGEHMFELVEISNHTAQCSKYATGSFTVGAFADQGNTELELDLEYLPGVSEYFRKN